MAVFGLRLIQRKVHGTLQRLTFCESRTGLLPWLSQLSLALKEGTLSDPASWPGGRTLETNVFSQFSVFIGTGIVISVEKQAVMTKLVQCE